MAHLEVFACWCVCGQSNSGDAMIGQLLDILFTQNVQRCDHDLNAIRSKEQRHPERERLARSCPCDANNVLFSAQQFSCDLGLPSARTVPKPSPCFFVDLPNRRGLRGCIRGCALRFHPAPWWFETTWLRARRVPCMEIGAQPNKVTWLASRSFKMLINCLFIYLYRCLHICL